MLQKTVNNKEYYKQDEQWYGTNKNNLPFKVTQKVLLEKLNDDGLGLGDMISKVTDFLGIKPCEGCSKRKQALNTFKLFPHLKKDIRELTDNELTLMKNILSKEIMESNEVDSMFALYNSLFGTKLVRCNCPGLCRTMIDRIQTIMNIQLNTLDDN